MKQEIEKGQWKEEEAAQQRQRRGRSRKHLTSDFLEIFDDLFICGNHYDAEM